MKKGFLVCKEYFGKVGGQGGNARYNIAIASSRKSAMGHIRRENLRQNTINKNDLMSNHRIFYTITVCYVEDKFIFTD